VCARARRERGAMRNLVVISEVHGVVEGDDDAKLQVAAAAADVDNGLFFVASQSSALLCYSLAASKVTNLLTNRISVAPPLNFAPCSGVFGQLCKPLERRSGSR
jgi:hypothetical protein